MRRRGRGGAISGFGGLTFQNVPIPFYTNNTLTYYGASGGFHVHFSHLTPEEKEGVKIMNVELYGNKLQELRGWCFALIIALGSCFIIPLFLLCCDCIKKCIYERRKLSVEDYAFVDDAISQLPNLENVSISVADNYLDINKTAILERNLMSCRKLTMFKFRNLMAQYDVDGREYSDFPKYFPQTKQSSRFMYSIQWGLKIFQSQNPGINMIAMGNMTTLNTTNINMALLSPMGGNPTMNQYPPSPNPLSSPFVM